MISANFVLPPCPFSRSNNLSWTADNLYFYLEQLYSHRCLCCNIVLSSVMRLICLFSLVFGWLMSDLYLLGSSLVWLKIVWRRSWVWVVKKCKSRDNRRREGIGSKLSVRWFSSAVRNKIRSHLCLRMREMPLVPENICNYLFIFPYRLRNFQSGYNKLIVQIFFFLLFRTDRL